MPFNKEELNTILKFGAEELFKEGDDEDEVQVRNSSAPILPKDSVFEGPTGVVVEESTTEIVKFNESMSFVGVVFD